MYRATLVTHYKSGLVGVKTHAVNGSLRLKQSLTLLGVHPAIKKSITLRLSHVLTFYV